MQLVQQGDPRAFELLYDRHGGAAFSLAYRMTGNRSSAEDVAQEAFLSIWRSRLRYQPERGSVRTWVLGIVHNRAIDSLRRSLVHDRRRTSAEGIEERQEAPERTDVEVARREEARHVQGALDTLPEDQRRTPACDANRDEAPSAAITNRARTIVSRSSSPLIRAPVTQPSC